MTDFAIILAMALAAFLLSWGLTPLTINLAQEVGAIDRPGARKVHRAPTPRLGGLAVFLSAILCLLGLLVARPIFHHQFEFAGRLWPALFLSAVVIFILGLYDDMLTLGIWQRLTIQMLAAVVVIAFGGFRVIGSERLFSTAQDWVVIVLTFLWVVGVTNAFNLIDGLDGLAVGLGAIAGIFYISTSLLQNEIFHSGDLLVILLVGLLLGFLVHNLHPANIFLGNNGSMATGFLFSVLILQSHPPSTAGSFSNWCLAGLLIGVPLMDTAACVIRRVSEKVMTERKLGPSSLLAIFFSDRAHIHHRLLDAGLSHRNAVWTLYGLAALCGVLSLGARWLECSAALTAAWLIAIAAFITLWSLPHWRLRRPVAVH